MEIIEYEDTESIQAEVRELGDRIKVLEDKQTELDAKQKDLLLHIPNIPDESTPIGPTEDYNVEVYRKGEPTKFDFEPKAHWDICEEKNIVDFPISPGGVVEAISSSFSL